MSTVVVKSEPGEDIECHGIDWLNSEMKAIITCDKQSQGEMSLVCLFVVDIAH